MHHASRQFYPKLFAPGYGKKPQCIVGRARERKMLLSMLASLDNGESLPHDAALHGPRGLGKTVLLHWLGAEANKGGQVRALVLSADQLSTPFDLANQLLGAVPTSSRTETQLADAGAKVGLGLVGVKGGGGKSVVQQAAGMDWAGWEDEFVAVRRKKPMVLMVDEAHTLDLKVARQLLNLTQRMRQKAPFALVLAGTPGLRDHLHAAQSTFWSQLGKGEMELGLLSIDEAVEGLRKPLVEHGGCQSVDERGIMHMVAHSDGYPYFVQLWGVVIEEMLHPMRRRELTMGMVREAQPEVERLRNNLYKDRSGELRRMGLTRCALALSEHLSEPGSTMPEDAAESVMAPRHPQRDGAAALQSLLHIGILQFDPNDQSPHGLCGVQAGIPSFLRYLAGGTTLKHKNANADAGRP